MGDRPQAVPRIKGVLLHTVVDQIAVAVMVDRLLGIPRAVGGNATGFEGSGCI